MDGCPNDSPALYPALHALTRKRKAADDQRPRPADAPPTPAVVPTHTQDTPAHDPAATPRHALAQEPWPPRRQEGPSKPKRPRIDIPAPTTTPTLTTPVSAHAHPRRLRRGRPPHTAGLRYPRQPRADAAVASAVEPRAHARLAVCPPVRTALSLPASPAPPAPALDPAALPLPPHTPPINRVSLRELDLEAILRNPQLRHDLLFDPGLQFRPTASRRKRAAADTYWAAVLRELATPSACTCATFDARGRPAPRRCVCARVPLPTAPVVVPVVGSGGVGGVTVRAPSRIGPLLAELREVLVSIIQPPAVPSQAAVSPQNAQNTAQKASQSSTPPSQNPASSSSSPSQSQSQSQNPSQPPAPSQIQNHHPSSSQSQSLSQTAAHVAHLRAILDAPLLAQARAHGLLAPAPVFAALGAVVRCYCAPMRDAVVERMVALARGERVDVHGGEAGEGGRSGNGSSWEGRESSGSAGGGEGRMDGMDVSEGGSGGGGTLGVVRAMRLCFEIMELMKLDVANHQLQTLRPYLVASAAQFELQTLQERAPTLAGTRRWLRAAWDALAAEAAAAALGAVSMNGTIEQKEQTDGRDGMEGKKDGKETVAAAWARAPRGVQMQIAVTRAVVGLIFDAAPPVSAPSASTSAASSPAPSASTTPASSVPSSPSPAHARIPAHSHTHPRSHPHPHPHSHSHSLPHPHGHGHTNGHTHSHGHGHQHGHTHGACAGYPETLYLDHARLATLRTDAADFTALYMLLMLFRQLVCSSASSSSPSSLSSPSETQRAARQPQRPVRQEELLAVKKEIWEIGPAHLGRCYLHPGTGGASSGSSANASPNMNINPSSSSSSGTSKTSSGGGEAEAARWREEIASVVLQLTARAGARRAGNEIMPMATDTRETGAGARETELLPLPDAGLLRLATGWAETNLRAEAPLSVLMRARIRRVVEETAVGLLLASSSSSSPFPPSASASASPFSTSTSTSSPSHATPPLSFSSTPGASAASATGLEPLMPEITHLAEKVRKLVGVHMDVYGALYAQPGFLGLGAR